MPRIARLKHDNAVYHIMVRGNNRENIFFDEDDKVEITSSAVGRCIKEAIETVMTDKDTIKAFNLTY